jgi:hypothetical protein
MSPGFSRGTICLSDNYILNLYNHLHNYVSFRPTASFKSTMALSLGSSQTLVSHQYGATIFQTGTVEQTVIH